MFSNATELKEGEFTAKYGNFRVLPRIFLYFRNGG